MDKEVKQFLKQMRDIEKELTFTGRRTGAIAHYARSFFFYNMHPMLGHLYAMTSSFSITMSFYHRWKTKTFTIPEFGTSKEIKAKVDERITALFLENSTMDHSEFGMQLIGGVDKDTEELFISEDFHKFMSTVIEISVAKFHEASVKLSKVISEDKIDFVDAYKLLQYVSAEYKNMSNMFDSTIYRIQNRILKEDMAK